MPYPSGTTKQDIVKQLMHKYKEHELKSSSGQSVADRKQAIAIALSESKKYGA